MKMNDKIIILGIETSCDETSASVILNGRKVLSNIISSQIEIHKKFGGVVPEVASRNHIKDVSYVVDKAIEEAGIQLEDLTAIAVTYAPGLEGALLVGLSYSKSLAYALNIPLVGVHHIEGHIAANYLENDDLQPPFIALIVSGGHTNIVYVKDYGDYEILGKTRDDAAGEAYDKVARVLGLQYPGGPKIDKLSADGDENSIKFPKVMLEKDSLDFSFSGLKSAVLNYVNTCKMKEIPYNKADVAASFQKAVTDVLVEKAIKGCKIKNCSKIVLSGGVACNQGLRAKLSTACEENNFDLNIPNPIFCTDNGAMIGACGYYNYINGIRSDLYLNANPNLKLGMK